MTLSKNHYYGLVFGVGSLLILVFSYLLLRSAVFESQADLFSLAITLDLTVLIPVLFYFLVVRPFQLSIITIAPVFLIVVGMAFLIFPSDHTYYLDWVSQFLILSELSIVFYSVYKIRKIKLAFQASEDEALGFLERLEQVLTEILYFPLAAKLMAQEISTFYYALISWKHPPEVPESAGRFTMHKSTGYYSILITIGFVAIVELFAIHLLLASWNEVVAWVVTCLSIYGYIFLIADAAAMIKRPSYFWKKHLELRVGFRWRTSIPIKNIERIERYKAKKDRSDLDLSLFNNPKFLIQLSEEVEVKGLFGIKRRSKYLGINSDWTQESWDEIILNESN